MTDLPFNKMVLKSVSLHPQRRASETRNRWRIVSVLSLTVTTAVVCSACLGNNQRPSLAAGCHGSFQDFAYTGSNEAQQEEVLPQGNWRLVSQLPSGSPAGAAGRVIAAGATASGSTSIWVARQQLDPTTRLSVPALFVFDTLTKEWHSVTSRISDTDLYVDSVFVRPDGSVWGRTMWVVSNRQPAGATLLVRYNSVLETFESVQTLASFPLAHLEGSAWTPIGILMDARGDFVLTTNTEGVFRYDPETATITREFDFGGRRLLDSAISPQGLMYMLLAPSAGNPISQVSQGDVLVGQLGTSQVNQLALPYPAWPATGHVFVDSQERVWLGAVGYADAMGTWHPLHPNPRDYEDRVFDDADRRWILPVPVFETSDGRLWFVAQNGGAWLDPSTRQGCWFTTDPNAVVVEDADGVVWTVVGDTSTGVDTRGLFALTLVGQKLPRTP